ncbi:MAG: OmpA family protein [Elusimicrobia bacterium]|nr:OmpA family protein [Elusimicrobiota bacterium]
MPIPSLCRAALLFLALPALAAGDLALKADVSPGWDIDPLSPPVTFRITGDGLLEGEGPDRGILAGIKRWQIQVFNFDEEKVDFIQGLGSPDSDRFHWDGVTRSGAILRDGFYTARLAWVDAVGSLRKTKPVQVSLFLPRGLRDFLGAHVRCVYDDDGVVIRVAEALTFAPGRWRLRPQALPVLDNIAVFLCEHPAWRLAVQGHADATGRGETNLRVSSDRARAVYQYLAGRGVGRERMTYEGLGAAQPIADNSTEAGRAQNRRVDIVVRRGA